MFERFTDRARRVVVLGQEEARMLNHDYIGTEHLLLGLAHESRGVAAKALKAQYISLDSVRQQVEEITGRGQQVPSGHIPFTASARQAMELALQESSARGPGFVDTEHLLIGVLQDDAGVATQVLTRLGADPADVRHQVMLLAPGSGMGADAERARWGRRERAQLVDDALSRLGLMDQRLAAVERWVGVAPPVADLELEIAHLRRQKEAAIAAEDFESAATLRDKEKDLVDLRASREQEWLTTTDDRLSLAAELSRVKAEVDRLRDILRHHGIDGTS
jgi:ATP-dependent Clp protease ATP-binding subunit ClpA